MLIALGAKMLPGRGKMEGGNKMKKITITWCIDDVLAVDHSLTPKQAREVLRLMKHRHDASIGINWDVIQCHIDQVKEDSK